MQHNNIVQVLCLLMDKLRIPVTEQTIADEIAKHPNFQSLLAMSEVLNSWKVPNYAYELSVEQLFAAELTEPFITHLANRGGEFVIVDLIHTDYVLVSNERVNKHRLTLDEFEAMFGGAVLFAEKDELSGEPNYRAKYRKELVGKMRIPFVIICSVLLLSVSLTFNSSFLTTLNWSIAYLTLFKTAGLVTSIMLLIHSIDANNPLIQKLCGGNNNENCNVILSSKAAKISDELSWSEVGFFYFAGTLQLLLFNNPKSNIIQLIALVNVVALPYTVYSIFYQWRVAKQWCVFCCIVQGLLWLEFFAFIPYLNVPVQLLNLQEIITIVTSMAIPILIWMFIKPFLLRSSELKPLRQQLRNFKYNDVFFRKLLNTEIKYILPDDDCSLIIGDSAAEHVITMVSNPYCQPCAVTHRKLDEWLGSREDIKLQVVFALSNNENDPMNKIATHLFSIKASQNNQNLKMALDDWYTRKQKDFEGWTMAHPADTSAIHDIAMEKQKDWCKLTDVMHTPTLFINGRKLPQHYLPEDIKYMI